MKVPNFEPPKGAIVGDGLSEGDKLALGLYKAMITLRLDTDIDEKDFFEYQDFREKTLDEADEVWKVDQVYAVYPEHEIFYFIKEFLNSQDELFHYVVSTVEEPSSQSHFILFSFPTQDKKLVDRYRKGELFEADEIVQEDSH